MLWCVAMGVVGDRSLAQDVVQQSAVTAMEKLGDFDPATSFAAWMSTIVRNIALNESRKRTRRRTSAGGQERLDSQPSPSHSAHGELVSAGGAEFDSRLLGALDTLEPDARACLLMRVVGELSYRQIGAALNIPEGTAASHVHRARGALRVVLGAGHAGHRSPSP